MSPWWSTLSRRKVGPRTHHHARGSARYSACLQMLWKCIQAVLYRLSPSQVRAEIHHGVWEALDTLYPERGGTWTGYSKGLESALLASDLPW